jgi:hypothetical protein
MLLGTTTATATATTTATTTTTWWSSPSYSTAAVELHIPSMSGSNPTVPPPPPNPTVPPPSHPLPGVRTKTPLGEWL